MRKILKFKIGKTGKSSEAVFQELSDNDDPLKSEISIDEPLHPDLYKKAAEFVPQAIDIMGLDLHRWRTATIRGITLKHDTDGIGAVFVLQTTDEEIPLNVTTRFVAANELDQTWIKALHRELIDCVNGKRQFEQGSLPLEEEPKPVAKKKSSRKTKQQVA